MRTRVVSPKRLAKAEGYTFIEIVIVSAIIAILASAILPLAKVTMQRQREIELRRDLREMRLAIDKFKDAFDQGKIAPGDLPTESDGYPGTLDQLVEGVAVQNDNTGARLRFLRRIPIDPMTKTTEWGKRSSRDTPTSKTWGGQNVWDVYSTSEGRALDGTKYSDW
ncbi:MAG TPA: prepilin-type N-terminal cleavage/methylation domain-containing protein [Vicinamibacterales bacterium]|nr:prepilin-type N-terminal cleavage/methylation domain-containing protein [Vicinamibacterales bacterium]